MQRRAAWFGSVLVSLTLAVAASGKFSAPVSLKAVLAETPYILLVKVQSLDLDKLAMTLAVGEPLKGKAPFPRFLVRLKGDAEAVKENQVPQLLKRVALDLPLVLFINQNDRAHVAFAYTNGTWFQMTGTEVDGKVVWSFAHFEPYLRGTFKGTTAELTEVIRGGLAGKKVPDVNTKEKPGLGPEVKRSSFRFPRSPLAAGPLFAVIPSVLVGGPLAVLAMLFPALFGGLILLFRRWMVGLSVLSLNSTLYLLQDWFHSRLLDSWWGTPQALWLGMSAATLLGILWAWRRHARLLAGGATNCQVPGKGELGTLLVVSAVSLGVLAFTYRRVLARMDQFDQMLLVFCAGLWLTTVHALYLRVAASRRRALGPALPGEGVLLWGMLSGLCGLAVTFPAGTAPTIPPGPSAGEQMQGERTARFQRVAWRFAPKEPCWIASSPTVAGDSVFTAVVHGALSRSGAVYCLDRSSGAVRWSFHDGGKMKEVFSSPAVAARRVFIGEGFHQDQQCKLYCLDANTGRKLWDFQTTSHTESSPCVVGDKVYFGAGDDGLYCLDAVTGKECWHVAGLHVDANPLVEGGKLYCGSGAGDVYKETAVFCVDAATGKENWRMPVGLPVWGGAALHDGRLFVGLGNGNFLESAEKPAGAVLCLEAATGKPIWQFDTRDGVLGRVVVGQAGVYFGTRAGRAYCVDPADGKERWHKDLASPAVASLALTDNGSHLIAIASEGKVSCLDANTGAVAWTFDVARDSGQSASLFSSPAVVSRREGTNEVRQIYFGAGLSDFSRGILYCLDDLALTAAQ